MHQSCLFSDLSTPAKFARLGNWQSATTTKFTLTHMQARTIHESLYSADFASFELEKLPLSTKCGLICWALSFSWGKKKKESGPT